jgi:hypothetical protein
VSSLIPIIEIDTQQIGGDPSLKIQAARRLT